MKAIVPNQSKSLTIVINLLGCPAREQRSGATGLGLSLQYSAIGFSERALGWPAGPRARIKSSGENANDYQVTD
jgi:hypothetical protein